MQVIAVDAVSNSSTSGGSPFTWNHTCTGSNMYLVVALYNSAGDQVTGVTYNGTAMAQVSKQNVFGGAEAYLFILANPTTGSSLAISVTKSSGNMTGCAVSYSGCKQTGQPDASTTGTSGASTTYSEALVSIADKCWHITGVFGNATNAISAGASTTVRTHNEALHSVAIGDTNAAVTPAGSNTLNFSASSMSWASNGITLSPAPDAYTLTAAQGSYAYTGFAGLFALGHTLVAAFGSYALTGIAATLTVYHKWINANKNTSSETNLTLHSSNWTNSTKHSSTETNQNKN